MDPNTLCCQDETCATLWLVAIGSFALGAITQFIVTWLCRRGKCAGNCAKKDRFRKESSPRPMKHHPAPADGSIEIYVGNLSYDLTEDRLRQEFEAFGKVNSARIICNRYNGKSKGFGFVHMPNEDEVKAAIAVLSEKEILGRKMKCNVAKNVAE